MAKDDFRKTEIVEFTIFDDIEYRLRMWESFSLSENFLDPLGSLQITLAPSSDYFVEYFKRTSKGKLIKFSLNYWTQFTGVIMKQDTTISRKGVVIKIQASGMLSAAIEASVSPRTNLSAKSDVPIVDLIEKTMAPFFGAKYVKVENNTGLDLAARSGKPISGLPAPIPVAALKDKDLKAQSGESVYGFCKRIVSRMGVLLTTTSEGQLLLDRPIYTTPPLYTLIQSYSRGIQGDYVLDGVTISDTNKSQFSEVVVRGAPPRPPKPKAGGEFQKVLDTVKDLFIEVTPSRTNAPYARVVSWASAHDPYKGGAVNAGTASGYAADAKTWGDMEVPYKNVPVFYIDENDEARKLAKHRYDSEVQYFKPKYIEDKKSVSVDRCKSWATLSMGVRNGAGYTIKCSVPHARATTGYFWTPNTVVHLFFGSLGINEDMWIFGRTFNGSMSKGITTDLLLMPLNALVLGDIPK